MVPSVGSGGGGLGLLGEGNGDMFVHRCVFGEVFSGLVGLRNNESIGRPRPIDGCIGEEVGELVCGKRSDLGRQLSRGRG